MKVYIGSDHHGGRLRPQLISYVTELSYGCEDVGNNIDFPIVAQEVAKRVLQYKAMGILLCRTGQGMAMAANRFSGIRAAVCNTVEDARQAREHLNANVMTMSADRVAHDAAKEIVRIFLETKFIEEERYQRRIDQID